MNLDPIIRAVQQKLGVTVDGKPGPGTWAAIADKICGPALKPSVFPDELTDPRSESNIATLHDFVKPYARALVHAAAAQGITIRIISGTRTFAEQDALFRQANDGKDNDHDGRTDEPDERVTRARAGHSNHNFGLAFDIGIFREGEYLEESPLYKVIGSLGQSLGLEWGGSWTSFKDEPHFQLRPSWAKTLSESQMLAELRRRHESGQDAFA